MDKIIRTEEEQRRAAEMYDSLRSELLRRDLSNTENYDKSILTLSSASLALSLTAVQAVVPTQSASHVWMIAGGWLFLLGSVIISLVAFLVSNKAIEEQMKNAENYYINCDRDAFNRKCFATQLNNFLNRFVGFLFVVGISLIVNQAGFRGGRFV